MNIGERDIELIDRYLKGELSEIEKSKFDKKLVDDKNFAKIYNQIDVLKLSLQEIANERKLKILKQIEKTEFKNKENSIAVPKKKFSRKLYYIASIAAIGLALVFALPQLVEDSSTKLVNKYFEPYPQHVIKRSSNSNLDKTKQNAYKYYSIEAYDKAIPLLTSLYNNGDKKSLIHLTSAYIGDKQYAKAQEFVDILASSNNFEEPTIDWYQAIVYLGQGKAAQAKIIANKLSTSDNPYKDKAKQLYEELNK